jgi:hypothetical protein
VGRTYYSERNLFRTGRGKLAPRVLGLALSLGDRQARTQGSTADHDMRQW